MRWRADEEDKCEEEDGGEEKEAGEKKEAVGTGSGDFKYLGSNVASGEGLRHYFLLPIAPIETLTGSSCSFLPVYTSSGANTGDICKDILCLIPFFGVATMFNVYDNIIIAPFL